MPQKRKLSRIERRKLVDQPETERKKGDPLWHQYKRPTRRKVYFHTFQKNALAAGNPISSVINTAAIDELVADYIHSFTQFKAFDLAYLESVLPLRYCHILPRNYAALLFALYIDALAQSHGITFIECYRQKELVNAEFERIEPKEPFYDDFLLNADFRERFLQGFQEDSKEGVFYFVDGELDRPDIPFRLNLAFLFDFEIFLDSKHQFSAFMNFSKEIPVEIKEGIVFCENKKKLKDEQDLDIFYRSGENEIGFTRIHWKPGAHINSTKWKNFKRRFKKYYELEVPLTYRQPRRVIDGHDPKILDKNGYNLFKEKTGIKKLKDLFNLTKDSRVFLPRDTINIKNYFLILNLVPFHIQHKLWAWSRWSRIELGLNHFYQVDATMYAVIKRLKLYKLVGPFRTICGLPKRKKRKGKVEFITPEPRPEIPTETVEILKQFATPSQVLFNIVQITHQNHGDVETALRYIRGIYRASRKISLMLKDKQFDLIPKVVKRYLMHD